MSMREVWICLNAINVRTHNAFAMQASLHGKKIPFRHLNKKVDTNNNLNKDEQSEIDQAMKQAIMRRGGKMRPLKKR